MVQAKNKNDTGAASNQLKKRDIFTCYQVSDSKQTNKDNKIQK